MVAKFPVLLVLALLCTATFVLAEEQAADKPGFWLRVKAFFSGDSDQVPSEDDNQGTTNAGNQGSTDGADQGNEGEKPSPTPQSPEWACTPCRSVICKDGDGLFVCPNKLDVCQKKYDGACEEITCKDDDTCKAKRHTCWPTTTEQPGPVICDGTYSACVEKYGTCDCGVQTSEITCTWNGRTWKPGDSFPAGDGCNTCTCGENGEVGCTKRACKECTQPRQTCYPADGSGPVLCDGDLASCTAKLDWCLCGGIYEPCDPDVDNIVPQCGTGYTCSKSGLCVPGSCDIIDKAGACEYARKNPDRTTGKWPGPLGISICQDMTCSEKIPSTCVSTRDNGPYCLKAGGTYACCGWAGGAKPYCDWGGKGCVQCLEDGQCKEGQICASGVCKADDTVVCLYNDRKYLPGESFPDTDGCNTCTCLESGQVTCTERACPIYECKQDAECAKPCLSNSVTDCPAYVCENGICIERAGACEYGGKEYAAGSSFPEGDGCNTCTCLDSGQVTCTDRACPTDDDRECDVDADCPELMCVMAPCGKNVCKDGMCIAVMPDSARDTA